MWPREHRHLLRGDAGLARLMHAYFVYFPALSYRPALLPDGRFRDGWQQVMDVDLLARILLGGGRSSSTGYRHIGTAATTRPPAHRTPAPSRDSRRRRRSRGGSQPTRVPSDGPVQRGPHSSA
jgi:hypothetical protein